MNIRQLAYKLHAQERISENRLSTIRAYGHLLETLPAGKEPPPYDRWVSNEEHHADKAPLYFDFKTFCQTKYLDQVYMRHLLKDKSLIEAYRHDLAELGPDNGPIGTTKEEWLDWYKTNRPQCREDVIHFIANILFHDPGKHHTEEPYYDLFACGYCYYFALMLQHAFGGKMMWHVGYGHIVWVDENDVAYDIGGIFEEASPNDGGLIPVEDLGSQLENFLHRKPGH